MKTQLSYEDTTSDTINRQQAIDALRMDISIIPFAKAREYVREGIETIYNRIEELPSVQPEPKEGHWILHETSDGGEQYECSECGVLWEFNDGTPEDNEAFYCPKCGVKMKGEQDGH